MARACPASYSPRRNSTHCGRRRGCRCVQKQMCGVRSIAAMTASSAAKPYARAWPTCTSSRSRAKRAEMDALDDGGVSALVAWRRCRS